MSDNGRLEKQDMIALYEPPSARIKPETYVSRPQGKSRRMRRLERAGHFGSGTGAVHIRRATTVEELCGAYRLVHDNFVGEGYIMPVSCGIRLRPFEALPDTATFIAVKGNRIVGVTSVVIDSPELGLPSDKVFPEEVDILRQQGRRLCEGTNWVIDPDYRQSNVMTELMRVCFAYSLAAGCNGKLGCVSPGHRHFYELLCFDTIGGERSSSPDINDPVVLEYNDYDRFFERLTEVEDGEDSDEALIKDYFVDSNPYYQQDYRQVLEWEELAQQTFRHPPSLRELFVERTDFLSECDLEELQVICLRWGEELFSCVSAEVARSA